MGESLELEDGSRVAVVGGGPAGALSSIFLLAMAQRIGMTLAVDLYEPRDFTKAGPQGCNMCGGIISESLVQMLATEGINLPPSVVRQGVSSYVLHCDTEAVEILPSLDEQRIASLYRGFGPTGEDDRQWESFDGFLLNLAKQRGVNHLSRRVASISREADGRPVVHPKEGPELTYDLLIGAVGLNAPVIRQFGELDFGFEPPATTKAYVSEIRLGRARVKEFLGSSMHVFFLDIPRMEFAALIPKGEFITVSLLGERIDKEMVEAFLASPDVRACLPPDWTPEGQCCKCLPSINVGGAVNYFGDRIVMVGDAGISRLYKDGMGAAYKTAKALAKTAIFHGVSRENFAEAYAPACDKLERDNRIGKFIFRAIPLFRLMKPLRLGMLRMAAREQSGELGHKKMSDVLWDAFTGSQSYGDVFRRAASPLFITRLFWESIRAAVSGLDGRGSR